MIRIVLSFVGMLLIVLSIDVIKAEGDVTEAEGDVTDSVRLSR